MAAGAAPGLPADRWECEITASLPWVAALLARVARLPIVGWVVGDVQLAQDDALVRTRARKRARRAAFICGTSKYRRVLLSTPNRYRH